MDTFLSNKRYQEKKMKKAVRLDKFLADAGAGTRSEVKKMIQKGQVQINGIPIKKPEQKVNEEDKVMLLGQEIGAAPEFVYYILHKPAGYISATEDEQERTDLKLIQDKRKGLFPVGRLDQDYRRFAFDHRRWGACSQSSFSQEACK